MRIYGVRCSFEISDTEEGVIPKELLKNQGADHAITSVFLILFIYYFFLLLLWESIHSSSCRLLDCMSMEISTMAIMPCEFQERQGLYREKKNGHNFAVVLRTRESQITGEKIGERRIAI